ncbi:MAG: PEP-CTERM sorting domain-containing protein [Chthoniobacter sp.]|uniref:PEP-CTERM sorting domain-containing protein n=1 Tax=Chthoniobacter sp. TaxID=2510640 RepID=UPI0032A8DD17
MKMTRFLRTSCAAVLSTAFLLALAPAGHAANLVYWVTLNTTSLLGNSNAPFSLDLQLVSGSGNVSNTVTLSNFSLTGGSGSLSPTGTQTYTPLGNTSGSLLTSVVLTSPSGQPDGVNEYAEVLPAGVIQIVFKVTETNVAEVVGSGLPSPDQFNVFIDDNSTFSIPTSDATGGTLVSNAMVASTFLSQVNTYTSQSPEGGVTASISSVPEPGSAALLLLGTVGLAARRKRTAALSAA